MSAINDNHYWKYEDFKFVLANLETMSKQEIARQLGRTKGSIVSILSQYRSFCKGKKQPTTAADSKLWWKFFNQLEAEKTRNGITKGDEVMASGVASPAIVDSFYKLDQAIADLKSAMIEVIAEVVASRSRALAQAKQAEIEKLQNEIADLKSFKEKVRETSIGQQLSEKLGATLRMII